MGDGVAPRVVVDALERCQEESRDLKQRAGELDRLCKALAQAVEVAPERPALASRVLRKGRPLLQSLLSPDAQEQVSAFERDCRARAEVATHDLVRHFPAALLEHGLDIDAGSRHPRYSLLDRLLEVELDGKRLQAKIRPLHGDLITVPLDMLAVIQRLGHERDRLLGRDFDPLTFLGAVTRAYSTLRADEAAGVPARVPVRDLAAAMSKGKPRLDEFAVDLGRLLASSELPSQQQQLACTTTRDLPNGILAWGLARGGYIGSIEVKESK